MKKTFLLAALLAGTAAYAQTAPVPEPTPGTPGPHHGAFAGHPELRKAEVHVHEAVAELAKAQENNHFDMEGHAAKAKALLEQAEKEIREASILATKEHRKGAPATPSVPTTPATN